MSANARHCLEAAERELRQDEALRVVGQALEQTDAVRTVVAAQHRHAFALALALARLFASEQQRNVVLKLAP